MDIKLNKVVEIQKNTLLPTNICRSILREAIDAAEVINETATEENVNELLRTFISKYAYNLLQMKPEKDKRTYLREDVFFTNADASKGYLIVFKSKDEEKINHCKLNNIFQEIGQIVAEKDIIDVSSLDREIYDTHPTFLEFSNHQRSYMDALDYFSDCKVYVDDIQTINMKEGKTFNRFISSDGKGSACITCNPIGDKNTVNKEISDILCKHIILNNPLVLTENDLVSSILDREKSIAFQLATKAIENDKKKKQQRIKQSVEEFTKVLLQNRLRPMILLNQNLNGHKDYYDTFASSEANKGKSRITIGEFLKEKSVEVTNFIV